MVQQGGPPQQGGPMSQGPQGQPPQGASPAGTAGGFPQAQQQQGQASMVGGQGMAGAGTTPATQRARRPSVLQPISIDDILAEDVVTAEPDTPIRTVVAEMAERDVGSVVVVDDGKPVGLITDRAVALALEETPDVSQRTAQDMVSGDVVTADPSMNIFDVIQLMSDEGIRRVPVVNEDDELQGIVTLDDVIVLLGTEFGNVAETIQNQISRL